MPCVTNGTANQHGWRLFDDGKSERLSLSDGIDAKSPFSGPRTQKESEHGFSYRIFFAALRGQETVIRSMIEEWHG